MEKKDTATLNAAKEYTDDLIAQTSVEAADASVVVVPGAPKLDNSGFDPTTVKVNIDNDTLILKNVAEDGQPAEYKVAVADSALVQYVSGNGVNVASVVNGEKVVSAVVKNNDPILSVDANGLQTTLGLVAITGNDLTALGSNVREAYKITGVNGAQIGSTIKIYKDSSLQDVSIVTTKPAEGTQGEPDYVPAATGQFFKFEYITAAGETDVVYLDASDFLTEAEAGDGIAIVNHKYTVNVDASSEVDSDGDAFLTVVSNGGVAVQGIKDEIAAEITALGTVTASAGAYLTEVGVSNGALTKAEEQYLKIDTTVTNNSDYVTLAITNAPSTNTDSFATSVQVQQVSTAHPAKAATYYTAEDEEVIAGTKQVGDLKEAAVTAAMGLAEASDVKAYVDAAISQGAVPAVTQAQIEGLFSGELTASEIAAAEAW